MIKYPQYETFQDAYIGNISTLLYANEYKEKSRIGECNEITAYCYSVDKLNSYTT